MPRSGLHQCAPLLEEIAARVGGVEGDRLSSRWREVPPGHYVLDYLTNRDAYAVCDTVVAMVEPKGG